ncbi:MAG: tetratricopeptide repeat protein [Chloroflexi bacterium]|nr:tetratricopeptide repeat protein [Chloroflexota bacterium]
MPGILPNTCHFPAAAEQLDVERETSTAAIDPEFARTVRALLDGLAAGREPPVPDGGALGHLMSTVAPSSREAVVHLAERWFGPLHLALDGRYPPPLNDDRLGETDRYAAILIYHVGQRRSWQNLSTNESTFYRYRRGAFGAFIDRLWWEILHRAVPTNRPRPDYERFVGRVAERAEVVQRLATAPGSVVGIEGAGGTGKTALAQAVVSLCLSATRAWRPVILEGGTAVPLFDAVVWVGSRQGTLGLGDLLDTLARTLDYPGLLGRELADRRSALREILGRRAVLIVVDDVDRADPAVLSFLLDLPSPTRSLVTTRRRLPPRVSAVALGPLEVDEALLLLRSEGARQSVKSIAMAPDAALRPLADATRRFPLLTVWAAGQLRQGQTLERVQARVEHAEGSVFEEMFAGSVQVLSEDARQVLRVLPIFAGPAHRPAVVAAAVEAADPEAGIDELLEASLLEATEGLTEEERQYALHPIARAFVRRRLPLDARQERRAVYGAIHHYCALAATYAGSVRQWASYGRIEAEIDNVLALTEAAARLATVDDPEVPPRRFDQLLVELAHALRNFFWLRHYWREGLEFFHRAVDAARRLGDGRAAGWNTYGLAYLHYELGTAGYREARVRAAEAVEILRQAGDLRGVGHAMRLLGRAARERGDFATAWRLLEEAEEILSRHGRGDDVAIVRASQADLLRRQGRLAEAAARYTAVLAAGLEDPGTRANVLHNLGDVRLRQGQLDVAEELFTQGEQVAATAGARGLVAECRWGLAQVAFQRGDVRRGTALAGEAADLFERLGEAERAHEARQATSLAR